MGSAVALSIIDLRVEIMAVLVFRKIGPLIPAQLKVLGTEDRKSNGAIVTDVIIGVAASEGVLL